MSKTPTISGLYEIRNLINDKIYVGSAIDIPQRFRSHKSSLRRHKHYNPILQNSWNKYGEKNFSFKKILLCFKKNLIFYEQLYLDLYSCVDQGFNIARTAGSPLGVKHSAAINKRKGRKGQEHHQYGKSQLKSIKDKISETLRGRELSEEHCVNISKATKGENNHFYGKNHSEESKRINSEAHKGRKASEETRLKMSKNRLGTKQELVSCIYCKVSGGVRTMKRWHLDNCKKKKNEGFL